jgi:DNA-binding NtrC family response regulator
VEKFKKSLDQIVEIFERNIIEKVLNDTHGNQSKAALILGISKRKIQYKISKYGINFRAKKENFDASATKLSRGREQSR